MNSRRKDLGELVEPAQQKESRNKLQKNFQETLNNFEVSARSRPPGQCRACARSRTCFLSAHNGWTVWVVTSLEGERGSYEGTLPLIPIRTRSLGRAHVYVKVSVCLPL